jgi:propanol-preferring alcohol dehydrogenase
MVYEQHLFYERELRSVTANTRRDGEEFLEVAAKIPISVTTTLFPFEEADGALRALAGSRFRGAGVLRIDP